MKRSKIMVATLSLCSLASAFYAEANTIKLNFKEAPLDIVLNHMSKSLGLSVVKKTDVDARITVMSQKELSQQEAMELLNSILIEKGYAAIVSGNILKIVSKLDAKKYNTPVSSIKDPDQLPEGDLIVTQIMKLNYVTSKDLVSTIEPLISETTVLSSNDSGNAIVVTDTQTNIKRFAKIIAALDRSATAAADIRVYRLENAEASDIATMITKIFNSNNNNKKNNTQQAGGGRFARMMQAMGRRGGGGAANGATATETVSFRITSVADKSTNSVVISAPEDMMPIIDKLIADVDIPATTLLHVEVFPLQHADASEVASTLTSIFSTQSSSKTSRNNNNRNQNVRFSRNNNNKKNNNKSGSDTDDFKAVADTRSNAVVISSSESLLPQVKKVINQLDNKPTNVTQVYIYDIQHADIEQLKETLEDMFGNISSTSSSSSKSSSSRNTTNRNSSNNKKR